MMEMITFVIHVVQESESTEGYIFKPDGLARKQRLGSQLIILQN